MDRGAAPLVRVCYDEGDLKRFVKGRLISENSEFIEIDLENYVLRIAKRAIIKIEAVKPRRQNYEY